MIIPSSSSSSSSSSSWTISFVDSIGGELVGDVEWCVIFAFVAPKIGRSAPNERIYFAVMYNIYV